MRNSSNKKTDESTVKQLRDKLATAELEILNLKGQNILLQEQNQELKYK